jgi:hypothetical protein
MEFILTFPLKKPAQQIGLKDGIVLLGSCFAEEMGAKLVPRRFNVLVNPHGILYNPESLATAISEYMAGRQYTQADLFRHNNLWHSYQHHGRFSQADEAACLQGINAEIDKAHAQLKAARWLIVTFGSAFAYRHKKSGSLVANCHKVPSTEFEKVLLTKESIAGRWTSLLAALQKFNPELRFVFTVSPVRYVRDGLVENNRSKGILLDSIHTLVESNVGCYYFPAYEIVVDELRDYRFYKEDLVHPTAQAVNYVWEKFATTALDATAQQFIAEYETVRKALQHRPFQESSQEYQGFRKQLEEKIHALEKKYAL